MNSLIFLFKNCYGLFANCSGFVQVYLKIVPGFYPGFSFLSSFKVYSLISVTKKQSANKNSAVAIFCRISQPGRQYAVAPTMPAQPAMPDTHRTILLRSNLRNRKTSSAEQNPINALPSTAPPSVTTVMNGVL